MLNKEFKKLIFNKKNPAKKMKRKINKLTTRGDWSWYPHPISIPNPFKRTTERPINMNIKIDPDEKAKPCNEVWVLFSEWLIKFRIFREITGKTHGIKFSKRPPINENKIATEREMNSGFNFESVIIKLEANSIS